MRPRRFAAGKVFAFTCFDGTRGAGRILDDLGAAGSVQFSGAGPIRHVRLPGNTPADPRPERLCLDQGHSVRALLQSRQAGRPQRSAARCPAWASPIAISATRGGGQQMLMARARGASAFAAHSRPHAARSAPLAETPRSSQALKRRASRAASSSRSRQEARRSDPARNEGPLELRRSTPIEFGADVLRVFFTTAPTSLR